MKKSSIKLAAVPVALALVAGACGSDSDSDEGSDDESATTEAATDGTAATDEGGEGGEVDFGGAEVTITGSERDDPSVAAINDTLERALQPD